MRAKFLILMGIVLCMAIPTNIQAQEKKQEQKTLKEIASFKGTIEKWNYNLNHIYNGFDLKVGDEIYHVEFPTTLGTKIRSIGNEVSVHVIKEAGHWVSLVSIQGKGEIIYAKNAENVTSLPLPDEFKSDKGKIMDPIINEWGKVIGFMVGNNTALMIPSQAAEQLSKMLEYNAIVDYTGMVKKPKKGEVLRKGFVIIHCHTITINGTQYLVR